MTVESSAGVRGRLVWLLASAIIGVIGSSGLAQDRPLPDLQTFLAQARTKLTTDNERQRSYIYMETQRERKLDGDGHVRSESVKVVESYPPLPGEDERWERVLEEDGKRKTDAELGKQDADRRKTAEAVAKKISAQTPADRTKAARSVEEDRKKAQDGRVGAQIRFVIAGEDEKKRDRKKKPAKETTANDLLDRLGY